MTQHTVDTLMALHDKAVDESIKYDQMCFGGYDIQSALDASEALRAALAEALAPKSHNTNSLRQDDGRCGLCGGDWYVCGCQGMVNRKSLPQAAQPAREPLSDEWIRERAKEPWIFETVKQWVKEIEKAHHIGGDNWHNA